MYEIPVMILNLKGFVTTKVGFLGCVAIAGCDEKSTFNGESRVR